MRRDQAQDWENGGEVVPHLWCSLTNIENAAQVTHFPQPPLSYLDQWLDSFCLQQLAENHPPLCPCWVARSCLELFCNIWNELNDPLDSFSVAKGITYMENCPPGSTKHFPMTTTTGVLRASLSFSSVAHFWSCHWWPIITFQKLGCCQHTQLNPMASHLPTELRQWHVQRFCWSLLLWADITRVILVCRVVFQFLYYMVFRKCLLYWVTVQ